MRHWNGNQVCAIDIVTTGLDPAIFEVCEIAVVPLNVHLEPDKKCLPFHFQVKPLAPDVIDYETGPSRTQYLEILRTGTSSYRVLELFEIWWKKLNLGNNKYGRPYRVLPLVYDAQHVIPFLRRFFGEENYKYMFREEHRDILSIATFMSDHHCYHGRPVLTGTGKCQWNYICNKYAAESRHHKGCMLKAKATAEAYLSMVKGLTIAV